MSSERPLPSCAAVESQGKEQWQSHMVGLLTISDGGGSDGLGTRGDTVRLSGLLTADTITVDAQQEKPREMGRKGETLPSRVPLDSLLLVA